MIIICKIELAAVSCDLVNENIYSSQLCVDQTAATFYRFA